MCAPSPTTTTRSSLSSRKNPALEDRSLEEAFKVLSTWKANVDVGPWDLVNQGMQARGIRDEIERAHKNLLDLRGVTGAGHTCLIKFPRKMANVEQIAASTLALIKREGMSVPHHWLQRLQEIAGKAPGKKK
jgi:hypothetical protein